MISLVRAGLVWGTVLDNGIGQDLWLKYLGVILMRMEPGRGISTTVCMNGIDWLNHMPHLVARLQDQVLFPVPLLWEMTCKIRIPVSEY
jgi:hypothetical protein